MRKVGHKLLDTRKAKHDEDYNFRSVRHHLETKDEIKQLSIIDYALIRVRYSQLTQDIGEPVFNDDMRFGGHFAF